MTLAYEVTNLT